MFEAGSNMIFHSMDPPDLFPYKPPQMKKVFGAFHAMLRRRDRHENRGGLIRIAARRA